MTFDLNFIKEAFSVLNSMIIPVVGFVITWSEVRDARKEKRIRDFAKAGEISPEDRNDYVQQALNIYRAQYRDEIARGELVVRDLIYPKEWVQPADSDRFLRLNDLPATIDGGKWKQPPPKSRYLPYMKEGFASNRKTFSSGALLFNGPLFALKQVTGSVGAGDLALTVHTAGYFDFLDTCEYLAYEMSYLDKVRRKKKPFRLGALGGLPQRSRQRELRDLHNRFCGIGVNNATILYNVERTTAWGTPLKEHYLLLHQRSGKVAECFGAISTIPAGSYQPVGLDLDTDFNRSLANTVYREFGEELLGIDEFSHLGDEQVLDEKYRRWPVLLLGLGIEPLNTKTEVMTAMKIDMDDPQNRELFGGNHTFTGLKEFFKTNYEGNLLMIPFGEHPLLQYLRDPRTTPVARESLSILLEHLNFFEKP